MAELEQLEACRICVNCFPLTEMDFINIFQPNEEFQQELDFIQGEIRQWQLKIQPDDGLPQRICANCFAKFCSIEAFRKECEAAQEKLLQTLMQQSSSNEPEVQNVIKNLETPLPLVGNYDSGSVVLDNANNVLVSSVNLTQSDVSLNDFPVFDQQFSHFDNPALMDASSTLLDGNLIAADTSQELGFLPSQNLFTFETAESPTTGTLPLVETETTSIINDILQVKPEDGGGGAGGTLGSGVGEIIIKQDLEDMLQRSIIPTNTKLTQQRGTGGEGGGVICGGEQKSNNANAVAIKMEIPEVKKETGNQYLNNNYTIRGRNDYQNTTITFINREDTNSDMECDDSDMNARLKGLSYACHYCFCPETGPIEHLVFPNEDALSQHFFDIHDPNRPYTCPKCPQSYKTQLLRDNHVRLIHKITEIQICNYCKKRLKGSTDVHQYNCQYVGDWECQNCKEKFPQTPLYRFRLHQRQHERIKQFKCRLCERTFMKKANMEAHQRMHKAEVQSAYSCNICKASFVDDYELKRHKYQQHSAEAPLKCKFCHKGFSSTVFLQRHMNQFHSDNAKNQQNNNNNNNNNNNACSSSSSSASSSTLNSPTEQHICLNCNMGFKTLLKLQNHLVLGRDKNGNCLSNACNKQERRKIQRQGVYPCFHCPRRFHLRSQLDKHLNTHDARLRPFQCEQCVTRCRTSCELKQHVNVAHLNIKAFSCDKCGKSFGYKKDLRDHMLFHAEINVHCTEEGCDYVCKNEKALNDHIRHKHRLLSCEYCHEQFTRQKLTAHLRKIHRAEIDVELAGESDNYYKSQLLNNNNDITQISFNLLNTQQQQQQQQQPLNQQQQTQLTNNSQQLPPSSSSQCLNAVISNSSTVLTTSSALSSSTITASSSSSSSSSVALTTCLTPTTNNTNTTKQGTNLNTNTTSISTHNLLNDDDVDHHHHHHEHDQLCAMFATDPHDSNTPTLALNGLVSNEHDDLNLVSNDDVVGDDATNMFLVPTTSSATNDNQLDQYFMASLIDTEQEIIVT